MALYSYIISSDYGFSPNPFWGISTLACCKPVIRRSAKVGDWVVGIRGKGLYKKMGLESNDDSTVYKIIYAMKVAQKLSFADYYNRYPKKRPDHKRLESIYKCGDNIYKLIGKSNFKQLVTSFHNDPDKQQKDLRGKFVLIADEFYYFGSKPIKIPTEFENLICGRGHKCKFEVDFQKNFVNFIAARKIGVNARPNLWNENDTSWQQVRL